MHCGKPVMCVIWFNPRDRPMRQVDLKYSLSTYKENEAQRGKGYLTEGLIHDYITSKLQSCGFNPSQPTLASVLSPHTCLSWWLSLYFHRDRGGPAIPVAMMTCRPSDVALETGPLITYCACWGQRMTPIGGSKMTEWTRYHLVHHLCALLWNHIYSKWNQIGLPLVSRPHCVRKTMIRKPTQCCVSKGLPNWHHMDDTKEKGFSYFKQRKERETEREKSGGF